MRWNVLFHAPYIIYNWEHLENGFDWIPYFIYLFSCFSFWCLGFNINKSQHSFCVPEVVLLIRKQIIQHFGQRSTSWVIHSLRTKINIWKMNRPSRCFTRWWTVLIAQYLHHRFLFLNNKKPKQWQVTLTSKKQGMPGYYLWVRCAYLNLNLFFYIIKRDFLK